MRNIAIAAGGDSSEYEVSVKSATAVSDALSDKYRTFIIVMRGKNWYWEDQNGMDIQVDKNDFSLNLPQEKIQFDAVFNAIHGTPGEDGLLQGYLEMMDIPYSSCGTFSSALTFDKNACKVFLKEFGIPLARSLKIVKGEDINNEAIISVTGLPCFVKPNASGSSFGVTKVNNKGELDKAIKIAYSEGNEILIESFLDGTEVCCGVLKTKKQDFILPITEIVSKNEFFDYEAKYTPGVADEISPARIANNVYANVQSLSSEIYDLLSCKGIVRVDFIIVDEKPIFLEINSVPGMSPESIIPKQLVAFGITQKDFYTNIIEDLF